jgi:hypothetical protein
MPKMNHGDPAAPTLAIRKIQIQCAAAARFPDPIVRGVRRQSRFTPQEQEVEEPWVPEAKQRADAVNRDGDQQCEEILAEEERLHREHDVHQ